MTPLATTRSMTRWDWRSTLAAASLSPPATALPTFLIALRTSVRRLMLCARRSTAWRARLRADLLLAMDRESERGRNSSMNLLRTLAKVSSLTMVSRVLGYVRDFFIARLFGASLLTDAFFVAFKIPNLLRRMFAEGAFSQAFVPILAEYKNRTAAEDTKSLIDAISTLLFLALVLAAALGMAAAPLIVYVTAPGFGSDPEKFALTVGLL